MAAKRIDSAWYGFLAITFAVVGLAGLFGSYACQVPYRRGEGAEQVLDRAAATHSMAELAAMKNDLGDNAAIMLRADQPLADRVVAARAATRARVVLDAADIGRRIRVVIGVITLVSALFGCALLGAAANQRRRDPEYGQPT